MCLLLPTSGLYYKPMMIVYDNSWVITKVETSLTDDARVIIYNHLMFIVQAKVRMLHPHNRLVVTINWFLILLNSTGLFLNFFKHTLENL
jgi:hypothetical protein